MGLRDQAIDAYQEISDAEAMARLPIIEALKKRAVKAAAKIGIESDVSDWRDFHNTAPDAVFADIDRIEFLFKEDEGLLFKVRRDVGYKPASSLAAIGEELRWQGGG